MVHIVRKKIGNYNYLYLQRSHNDKGRRYTEHVAYLGRESKYTKAELNMMLQVANSDIKNLEPTIHQINRQKEEDKDEDNIRAGRPGKGR